MDSTAIFKLSYGMFVIGVSADGKDSGCVVNTVMQVTSSPVKLSTVIAKTNYTHELVNAAGRYTISVLTKDVPPLTIGTFGFMSGRDKNKFESAAFRRDAYGVPHLTEGVNAYLSCKVLESHDLGSHTMFISDVTDAETLSQDESMTYAYYRIYRKGTSPKAAPTHEEVK